MLGRFHRMVMTAKGLKIARVVATAARARDLVIHREARGVTSWRLAIRVLR